MDLTCNENIMNWRKKMGFGEVVDLTCNENIMNTRKKMGFSEVVKKKDGFWASCGFGL